MTRWTAVRLLVAVFWLPGVAGATDAEVPPPKILGVRVGLAGHYKVGTFTPVQVKRPRGYRVRVTVPDGDGVPSRVTSADISGDSVLLYARFGRVHSRMTVELLDRQESRSLVGGVSDGDRTGGHGTRDQLSSPSETPPTKCVDRQVFATDDDARGATFDRRYRPAIAATRRMLLSVAAMSGGGGPMDVDDEPLGVADAVEWLLEDEDRRTVVARVGDGRQLPDRWCGYEGVDAVVLCTSRPEIFKDLKPDGPRVAALDRWIRMGGKLVFCVGSQGAEILAEGAPLSRFAPGKFQRMVTLRQTRSLETYASSSVPVPEPADGTALELRVPRLADVEGMVLAREADLPLVVRTRRGLGQIVFLAADLDRPPLKTWDDRPALVGRLLDLPAGGGEKSPERSAAMYYGYDDVSGQLRSALDQFADVRPVPFWTVAMLIVVYVLLIGPADYFFLRKVTRRMQWTWLTFSAIVLGVSLAAYGLAGYLKGDQVRVNQVDLVDVDAASGYVRGTTWANVFSPQTDGFNLSLRANLLGGPTPADGAVALFSWHGLPGQFLGGMNPRAANLVPWTEHYDFSPGLDAMHGVPIPIASTKSFVARFSGQTPAGENAGCLQGNLLDEGLHLSGESTNTLGFPLLHCKLAYDRYAYELGTLEPGADKSVRIDVRSEFSELKTLLTRRQFHTGADDSLYQQTTKYDQSSVELPSPSVAWYDTDVLRVMMFFEAAGGRAYTGLSNGYQSFVDLSGLLDTGCAILIGQAPAGRRGAELLRDGRPMTAQEGRHVTIYRFVFPVKKTNAH